MLAVTCAYAVLSLVRLVTNVRDEIKPNSREASVWPHAELLYEWREVTYMILHRDGRAFSGASSALSFAISHNWAVVSVYGWLLGFLDSSAPKILLYSDSNTRTLHRVFSRGSVGEST